MVRWGLPSARTSTTRPVGEYSESVMNTSPSGVNRDPLRPRRCVADDSRCARLPSTTSLHAVGRGHEQSPLLSPRHRVGRIDTAGDGRLGSARWRGSR